MRGHTVGRLGWAVVPLALLGWAVHLGLGVTSPKVSGRAAFAVEDAVWVLGQLVFVVVGALVVSRRRQSPIGWLFCAAGLTGIAEGITARYAVHALAGAAGWPAGGAAAWLSAALWYPNNALLVLAALLFPSGRPPSPRWWPVAWLLGAGGVFAAAAVVLLWPVRGLDLLGASPSSPDTRLGTALMEVAVVLLIGAGAATALALLARLRHARGVERQQLKWLTYAGALAVVGALLILLPEVVGLGSLPGPLDLAGTVLNSGAVLGIPVAAGIAILRYRLYDIDHLIRRTLVYGLLTAALGLGYAGLVLTLGQVFGGVSGDPPSWAVAGATLAAAGLVRPARRRLQDGVDRRFNRRRRDAARTIEAFGARLRHEVDLDTLTVELLAVVDRTMEPTSVSLWLRPPASSKH